MSALAVRHCVRHEGRAASGVCAHCGRPFCKECLTPHDGRLACAACLARLAAAAPAERAPAAWPGWTAAVLGLLLLWTAYSAAGLLLARLPSPEAQSPEEAP